MDKAFAHGAMGRRIDPSWLLHDWCNKGRGMCVMMHIKKPLLLIEKSSLYGGSGFPPSLFKRSFTICLTPYIRKCVHASLNKTFPSFLLLKLCLQKDRKQR